MLFVFLLLDPMSRFDFKPYYPCSNIKRNTLYNHNIDNNILVMVVSCKKGKKYISTTHLPNKYYKWGSCTRHRSTLSPLYFHSVSVQFTATA